jgi:cytidylate kinase
VYLKARAETRAARIVKREGGKLEEVAAFTAERDRQDNKRYKNIYNIDNFDYQFADIIIDTDNLNPDEITQIIIDAAQRI